MTVRADNLQRGDVIASHDGLRHVVRNVLYTLPHVHVRIERSDHTYYSRMLHFSTPIDLDHES